MSTTTPLPLAGKSALVTGAARSIGAETQRRVCTVNLLGVTD